MSFVTDLAHRRVRGSVVEHESAESEGLRFDPHGDSEFFLCPKLVTSRKTSFSNIHICLHIFCKLCGGDEVTIPRLKRCMMLSN